MPSSSRDTTAHPVEEGDGLLHGQRQDQRGGAVGVPGVVVDLPRSRPLVCHRARSLGCSSRISRPAARLLGKASDRAAAPGGARRARRRGQARPAAAPRPCAASRPRERRARARPGVPGTRDRCRGRIAGPWSTGCPSTRRVAQRPPTPPLRSTTTTRRPASASVRAQARPARPAPTIRVSVSTGAIPPSPSQVDSENTLHRIQALRPQEVAGMRRRPVRQPGRDPSDRTCTNLGEVPPKSCINLGGAPPWVRCRRNPASTWVGHHRASGCHVHVK